MSEIAKESEADIGFGDWNELSGCLWDEVERVFVGFDADPLHGNFELLFGTEEILGGDVRLQSVAFEGGHIAALLVQQPAVTVIVTESCRQV